MRRPIRTRRLSITSIGSLLAFVVVAGVGTRSFWTWDSLTAMNRAIGLEGGYFIYMQVWGAPANNFDTGHQSADMRPHVLDMPGGVLGFAIKRGSSTSPTRVEKDITIRIPLWFPLLLMLIAPARWLIARPPSAPAFPVVTDAKREFSPH